MVAKIVLLVSCLCAVQAAFAKDISSLLENNLVSENDAQVSNNNQEDVKAINTNEDFEAVHDFSPAQIYSEEASAGPSVRFMKCAHLSCNSFCRNRGYHVGHCVNANTCRCYRFW